jgi:hypothetical protein
MEEIILGMVLLDIIISIYAWRKPPDIKIAKPGKAEPNTDPIFEEYHE